MVSGALLCVACVLFSETILAVPSLHGATGPSKQSVPVREGRMSSDVSLASPVSPESVIISPNGGVLTVSEKIRCEAVNGQGVFSIVLPFEAQQVRISVENEVIVQQDESIAPIRSLSAGARTYTTLFERKKTLQITVKVLEERLELWQTKPDTLTLTDLEAWDAKKKSNVTALLTELAQCQEELALLEKQLKELKAPSPLGRVLRVTIARDPGTAPVSVRYTYSLAACGWEAHYAFAIAPEQKKDVVEVRLMADIWQTSGFDWNNCSITLVSGTRGKLNPPRLAHWILEAKKPRREDDDMVALESSAKMSINSESPQARSYARAAADTSGIYARWKLPAASLPEGRSTTLILADTWKEPLKWIARPNKNRGDVFITATHDIAPGEVWPDGEAVFSVSGQNTGKSLFSPKAGRVELFFGNDPRISLDVVEDRRKRGESGFFGRDQTWSWGWEYVLKNTHAIPVEVVIERPDPQPVQESIQVRFEETPKAEVDTKKHVRSWTVTVPAGGKEVVRHAITVKAPENLGLDPIVP